MQQGQKTIAALMEDALALHRLGRLEEAGGIYRLILKTAPEHPDALHLLGLIAHQTGQHSEAAALIRRAIALNPASPRYHNNFALALAALGEWQAAAQACRQAIALKPAHVEAHFTLANALAQLGEMDEAQRHYQTALALQPGHAGARAKLGTDTQAAAARHDAGVALYQAGKFTEALACYQEALRLHPAYLEAHNNMGLALHALGRPLDAVASFQRALALPPPRAEVHNNLARTLRELGRFDEAIAHCRAALALRPGYADVYGNLGGLYLIRNQRDEALAAFRQQALLDPGNSVALHQIAALVGEHTERAPMRYVESVFDGYASQFDSHLVTQLQYQTPNKLAAFLTQHIAPPAAKWDVLDLGCGTGLAGVAIAPYARRITGVDLSANMLEKAAARGLYQRLEKQDLVAMMQAEPAASYDLLIAADVFVYLGRLDDMMREAKRLLRAGGAFAFSIEALEANEDGDEDYRLMPTGRYAQSPAYIGRLAAACQFQPPQMSNTVIRVESNTPVSGWLVILQS